MSASAALIVLGIGAVLAWSLYDLQKARKRECEFKAAGEMFGFFPVEEDQLMLTEIPLLSIGLAEPIVKGRWSDTEAYLFDFTITGKRDNSTQTVAGFRKEGLNVPPFELRPHKVTDAIAEVFSFEYLHFDDVPEFERMFTLKTPYAEGASRYFNADFRQMLSSAGEWTWVVQGSVDSVVVFRSKDKVAIDQLSTFVDSTGAVGEMFFRRAAELARTS